MKVYLRVMDACLRELSVLCKNRLIGTYFGVLKTSKLPITGVTLGRTV